MNFKNTIGKIIPTSIKSILRGDSRKIEILRLNSLNRINCDTSNLLAKDNVELTKIFNSDEINSLWAESIKGIDAFNIPDFTGGVNPGDRRAIFYLISYFKPNSVLEIGTHIGASTINIASALNNIQHKNKTKSIFKTLDIRDVNSISEKPWLQFGTEKSPIEMIRSLKYETFVEFITDTSFNYLKTNDEKFDFIFLDGNHSAKMVYKEIPLSLEKLNKNGVILLHDYFPNGKPLWSNKSIIPGPFLATKRHIVDGADISIIPLGDLPWSTKFNSNRTSLALLLKNELKTEKSYLRFQNGESAHSNV